MLVELWYTHSEYFFKFQAIKLNNISENKVFHIHWPAKIFKSKLLYAITLKLQV